MDKVTYTPAEFAEVFGKEKTWAYRQLYAGKVHAVTSLGRTLIPKSEVDRLLADAGRYLGANVPVKKGKGAKEKGPVAHKPKIIPEIIQSGGSQWVNKVRQRRTASKSSDIPNGMSVAKGSGTPQTSTTPARLAAMKRMVGKNHPK